MNAIDSLFQRLREKKKKAFIPFITAGDPDLQTTVALIQELGRRGASLIEVGFPYSDPIADGSVIQASYTRALEKGLRIRDIFERIRDLKADVPLAAMVSFSLIHHRGGERFIDEAQNAGFSGAIVPDLPVDESDELRQFAAKRDFKLIHLVTPTTPRDRAAHIAKVSTGFLYCVSVTGITGERSEIPPQLIEQLRWLRSQTSLPLCVGFGVSKPEHVKLLRDHCDGVIVGSALVRQLAEPKPVMDLVKGIGDQVASLVAALD